MSAVGDQFELVITCLRLEADGVVSVELRAADGSPLPPWTPGAHIDLLLPSGLMRQYSLCGDPEDRQRLRIAVLLEANGRGGSREVHGNLRLGQRVAVRGPRNAFELQPADAYLFVAGGIGITPILPMIQAAERAGADWRLIYGGRSRRSMAFVEELRAFGRRRLEILPADELGPLDLALIVERAAAGGLHTYSCGPAGLLDALAEAFEAAELGDRLHLERFAPAAPKAVSGEGLRVILARSGGEVEVPPDCSIMAALRAAGHEVASSCEQGICGMCETRVLDGVPDHRDMLLSESERRQGRTMMLCVSRALTPTLTLDL